jgi:hydroxyacylglutathione hydrolase
MSALEVRAVPMLRDNYGWLISAPGSRRAAVVDPSEAAPVLAAAEAAGLELVAALATHHHLDHVGGVLELVAARPGLEVLGFGPDAARLPGLTRALADGEAFEVAGLRGRVLAVPCHTRGHVAYAFEGAGRPTLLFTGDTLFAAGCGRFFEGTADDMHRALATLARFADDTAIFCGHEYTESNLRFAASVEPSNPAIARKAEEVRALRGAGRPSVPTRLGEERAYNPFLRLAAPELVASLLRARPEASLEDEVEVLRELRALKDAFV